MERHLLYRTLDTASRQIRLLRLHGVNDHDVIAGPLIAELEVHPMDRCPLFDSISYAWGAEFGDETIALDGRDIVITQNLHDVLCVLRDDSNTSPYLWVDALCINQQDLAERSHQVSLMREIYSKASTVHIWLGRGDDTTEETLRVVIRASQRLSPDMPNMHLLQGEVDSLDSRDLEKLFRNSWWDRLWTVQEAVMATNPQAHFGHHAIYLPALLRGILAIFRLRDQNRPGHLLPHYTMQLAMKFTAPILAASKPDSSELESIPDLLAALRGSHVTVKHDRIYGMLGLLPPQLDIHPDYSMPLEAVYQDFTLRVMQFEQSLDVLGLAGIHGTRTANRPSWVPLYEESAPFLFRATSGFDASKALKSRSLTGYPFDVVEHMTDSQIRVWAHLINPIDLVLSPVPVDVPGNFLSCPSDERGKTMHFSLKARWKTAC